MRPVLLACLLAGPLALLPAALPCHAQAREITTRIARTLTPPQVLGAQHRPAVEQALHAIGRGDLDRGLELLQPVITYCDGLLAQDGKRVAVADAEEYQAYVAANGDGEPVDWVDMACPEAYHAHAFVDVERKDAPAAFAALDKAARLAPYWVDPLTERGHLLTMAGKPAEGLASYRAALALVEGHPANRPMHALVLRGIGYCQVELGDLDAAEQAYRHSLELEPGNATATSELEYIRQQREKAAAKP